MSSKFAAFAVVQKTQLFPQPLWALRESLIYTSALLKADIVVPAGFVTDGASIPRWPLVYYLEGGKCDEPAYVHDLLYTMGSANKIIPGLDRVIDRATADAVLKEAIIAIGYDPVTADLFYTAVRNFGQSHWELPNQPQAPGILEAP